MKSDEVPLGDLWALVITVAGNMAPCILHPSVGLAQC